jgi:hypothetical protein
VPHTFIKLSCDLVPAANIIKELFPSAKLIFNTRTMKSNLSSIMSCIEGLPLFARWSHSSQGLYNNAAIPYNDPEWSIWREELSTELGRYKGELPFLLLNYAGQIMCYLNHKSIYEQVILYEDLISNPKEACKKIFAACGYDQSYITQGVEAMKNDSQGGLIVNRTTRLKADKYPQQLFDGANITLKKYRCPINTSMGPYELHNILDVNEADVSCRLTSYSG